MPFAKTETWTVEASGVSEENVMSEVNESTNPSSATGSGPHGTSRVRAQSSVPRRRWSVSKAKP